MHLRAFFGQPGEWFDENNLDGDKTSIFHDVDGSVTGYGDTYVGRADNYLIQHPGCVKNLKWNGVICSGRYSQVQRTRVCTSALFCPSDVKAIVTLHNILLSSRCTSRPKEPLA